MPYPGVLKNGKFVADGLAFSSRNSIPITDRCPKSLDYVLNAVDEDIYSDASTHLADTYDLTKWANQGILLLNTSLSLPIGEKAGAHIALWRPFILAVLEILSIQKEQTAYILMGAKARAYESYITDKSSFVVKCDHPAAAAYTGGKWDHQSVFFRVDAYHRAMNNIKIDW